jgi:hypothetical protein
MIARMEIAPIKTHSDPLARRLQQGLHPILEVGDASRKTNVEEFSPRIATMAGMLVASCKLGDNATLASPLNDEAS